MILYQSDWLSLRVKCIWLVNVILAVKEIKIWASLITKRNRRGLTAHGPQVNAAWKSKQKSCCLANWRRPLRSKIPLIPNGSRNINRLSPRWDSSTKLKKKSNPQKDFFAPRFLKAIFSSWHTLSCKLNRTECCSLTNLYDRQQIH